MPMTLEELCEEMQLSARPVGVYDLPEIDETKSYITPSHCMFEAYDAWQEGKTLLLTSENYGCPGCGYWFFNKQTFPSKERYVYFLAEKEGLKASSELMKQWVDSTPPYQPTNDNICIGPVRDDLAPYLKTVVFFVTVDELSILLHGAVHHSRPSESSVIAPFGSACGQILPLLTLDAPQAAIGSTDLAMRSHLPEDRLSFAVTVPMLERLLSLDKETSFLGKAFLRRMRKSRVA